MAEAIKKACGVESELQRSGGGVFEVRIDDKLVFSKKNSHRFPEPDEIIAMINRHSL